MKDRAPFLELVVLVGGFLIWSLALIALYALHSLGCQLGWSVAVTRVVMLVAWVAHLVAGGAFLIWTLRRRREGAGGLLPAATVSLAAAGVLATIWLGTPVLVLRACV
jgi:hypothetical protein